MVRSKLTYLSVAFIVGVLFWSACKSKELSIKENPMVNSSFERIADERKKALIIAIGNYQKETYWKPIKSLNDTSLLIESLGRQGFNQFLIVSDSQASREGVLRAFDEFSKLLNEGDVAVVHISSHGQQIEDDNGDEADRLDESIACFNSPMLPPNSYKGELHLRDDELGVLLDKLRQKLGASGDLLVMLDACYSGTGTRGPGSYRGGAPAIVSENFQWGKEDETIDLETSLSRGVSSKKAGMTVISAAKANEKNKEYKDSCGSLSLAFHRASQKLNPGYTYQALFSEIQREMAVLVPYQQPTLEGEVNRQVFGGHIRNQHAFYTIEQLFGNDLKLIGGSMTGLQRNSIIEVHKAGTAQPSAASLVATGEIYWADPFSARASLDKDIGKDKYAYWVFVKQKRFEHLQVRLSLENIGDKDEQEQIQHALELSPLIAFAQENNEFYLIKNQGEYRLNWSADSSVFRDQLNLSQIREALDYFVQGQFLKALEFNHPDFDIRLSFVPVNAVKQGGKWEVLDTLSMRDFTHQGLATFKPGDHALLRVTNDSEYDLYFNMIYLDPKGEFQLYIPKKSRTGSWREYKLLAGDSMDISYMLTFGEPSEGIEMFKLFASSEPINFGPIFSGSVSRGSLQSNMDQIFYQFQGMTRGETPEFIDNESKARSHTLTFKVLP